MASKSNKMELGWSYPKRKKHLEDVSKKDTGKTQREFFQNKNVDFQKYPIPIGLPKYRIDNGRTYAAQAKYLAAPQNKELSKDFFTKDPELEQVQQAQHEILKGMIGEKGLSAFFKKHGQSDAIILSHDGYVINGNRRLCAWREHFAADSKKFGHFSHIDVIILPPADPKDIDELEARLQIRKDIKADYTWTSRALMLKNRQSTYKYETKELADLFEMSKNDVEELIDMLSYADTYLDERDKIGQYDLVDKAEFAFRQLHKKRSKIKGEPYKEVFEKLAFCLIDGAAEGRRYEAVPQLADNLNAVIENIEEEFNVEEAAVSTGIDLLGGKSFTSLKGVIDVINKEENHEQLRTITLDVIEAENNKNREKSKRDFVHSQVKKANTALVEAVSAIEKKTKKEGIASQIAAIETSLTKLKEWLDHEDKH